MARIKMHIPYVKLPFYHPCEVKYRLQNGVSTTVARSKQIPGICIYQQVDLLKIIESEKIFWNLNSKTKAVKRNPRFFFLKILGRIGRFTWVRSQETRNQLVKPNFKINSLAPDPLWIIGSTRGHLGRIRSDRWVWPGRLMDSPNFHYEPKSKYIS